MTETGRTRRNFDGNPDRGNKLSLKNPRGLRGGKFGAAGPVTHIDPKGYQLSKPAPSAPIKPPRRTKKPKLPTATLPPLQRRPYQPFDQADAWKPIDHDANPAESARRFNIIEAMYPR